MLPSENYYTQRNLPPMLNNLGYSCLDWLTENPIKFAIIKALPLDEKEDYILSFIPWYQITENMWRNSCVEANAIRKFRIILEVGLILWLDFISV